MSRYHSSRLSADTREMPSGRLELICIMKSSCQPVTDHKKPNTKAAERKRGVVQSFRHACPSSSSHRHLQTYLAQLFTETLRLKTRTHIGDIELGGCRCTERSKGIWKVVVVVGCM